MYGNAANFEVAVNWIAKRNSKTESNPPLKSSGIPGRFGELLIRQRAWISETIFVETAGSMCARADDATTSPSQALVWVDCEVETHRNFGVEPLAFH